MHRFVFNKPSKMFSKHYDNENRDISFSENGNYSFEIFLQETKPKIYKIANLLKEELNNELLNIDISNAELVEFTNTVLSILDKHVTTNMEYFHANNSTFLTKELRAQ